MTDTEVLRNKVRQYVDKADEKALKKVQAALENNEEEDWWDSLPENMQVTLERAIKEGDAGKGTPHEEVMAKFSKWFKK